MEKILIYTTIPVYILFIGLELYLGHIHKKVYYDKKDSVNSLLLGLGGAAFDLLMKGFGVLLFYFVIKHWQITKIENIYWYWIALFFVQDFLFYWLHRTEHTVRLFWAVHVNHHSSEKYNFMVALRSSMIQPLYRYLFFLPAAFFGFEPMDVMLMYAINQIYQFFLHTETIGKLGFLEKFMVTPSHHRVHHASNINYLDKNMGQVLIIWDKLFGTFQEELDEDVPKFGLTYPLKDQNFFTVWLHEWWSIGMDMSRTKGIKNKIKYLLNPPGWSHDGKTKTAKELRKENPLK